MYSCPFSRFIDSFFWCETFIYGPLLSHSCHIINHSLTCQVVAVQPVTFSSTGLVILARRNVVEDTSRLIPNKSIITKPVSLTHTILVAYTVRLLYERNVTWPITLAFKFLGMTVTLTFKATVRCPDVIMHTKCWCILRHSEMPKYCNATHLFSFTIIMTVVIWPVSVTYRYYGDITRFFHVHTLSILSSFNHLIIHTLHHRRGKWIWRIGLKGAVIPEEDRDAQRAPHSRTPDHWCQSSQKETIENLIEREAESRKKIEVQKASSEMMKDQVLSVLIVQRRWKIRYCQSWLCRDDEWLCGLHLDS